MNKIKILAILLFISSNLFARTKNSDSLAIKNIEFRMEQIDNQLKEVRRDELNYQIEKNLLKETYSNSYERISLIITIILGIIGILGYMGIKDINSIKKEYTNELAKLKQLQTDLASKFTEFQTSKVKYDSELHDILRTNEEQNNKIKVLELKEKINNLIKEDQYGSALEFCIVALELSPTDTALLRSKALIFTRLRNFKESISTYIKILEIDKNNNSAVFDLTEVYLMSNQRIEYNKMLTQYSSLFKEKMEGKLLEIFSIITSYQDKEIDKLKAIAFANINLSDLQSKGKKTIEWDLKDLKIYLANEPSTQERIIAQNIIWYLDGLISGTEFFSRTGLEFPSTIKK